MSQATNTPATVSPAAITPATAASAPHWARPDVARDLLAIAVSPGLAPPTAIHVRPELYELMLTELDPATRAAVRERGVLGEGAGIRLVVDPSLPSYPGFEVHRASPGVPVRPHVAAA